LFRAGGRGFVIERTTNIQIREIDDDLFLEFINGRHPTMYPIQRVGVTGALTWNQFLFHGILNYKAARRIQSMDQAAKEFLGRYNLTNNNCQHFIRDLFARFPLSQQVLSHLHDVDTMSVDLSTLLGMVIDPIVRVAGVVEGMIEDASQLISNNGDQLIASPLPIVPNTPLSVYNRNQTTGGRYVTERTMERNVAMSERRVDISSNDETARQLEFGENLDLVTGRLVSSYRGVFPSRSKSQSRSRSATSAYVPQEEYMLMNQSQKAKLKNRRQKMQVTRTKNQSQTVLSSEIPPTPYVLRRSIRKRREPQKFSPSNY
jgi:hypothetical protein